MAESCPFPCAALPPFPLPAELTPFGEEQGRYVNSILAGGGWFAKMAGNFSARAIVSPLSRCLRVGGERGCEGPLGAGQRLRQGDCVAAVALPAGASLPECMLCGWLWMALVCWVLVSCLACDRSA